MSTVLDGTVVCTVETRFRWSCSAFVCGYSLLGMTLRVDEDDIVQFAAANDQVAGEVIAGCQPDPGLIAAMTTGYGPVGAEFTSAVAEFQEALLSSGSQLAHRYEIHAQRLRAAGARYVAGDQDGAAAISSSSRRVS